MNETSMSMALWDDIHARNGSMLVAEARDAWVAEWVAGVQAGRIHRDQITLEDEALRIFNVEVKPGREKRRRAFGKAIEYLTDSILNIEDGANLDPLMDHAYPLGDGSDKSLREWTPDDYRTAVTTRYRGAADQTASAADFDAVTSQLLQVMTDRGVAKTGDLFEIAQ